MQYPSSTNKEKMQMTRALQKHVARRQDQTFADWFAELRELAGERWADVADQHRANLAKTQNESEKLIATHNDEQGAIESQLTTLVPTNYFDACYLLEFATVLAE